ncbi:hypothetical protein OsJ_36254 [Oryza sativa Japonica Group]|uniref:Uncharacterized protein n=1 Tax=Oryza sativa subsp. japonica TaxID=39947 RepID=A3CHS5_ORYSJ|nr:hypothetical protein OsJ_36254 [Oryza sativa Japonica Group]
MALSLAPRASLAKTESIKKRDKNNNKGSKRARLRAGLSAALHLGGGHRRAGRRGGGGDEGAGAVSSAAAPGVAVLLRAGADDADEPPAAAAANVGHGGRDHASGGRGRSWAVAVAMVLVLALRGGARQGPGHLLLHLRRLVVRRQGGRPRVPATVEQHRRRRRRPP